jgi:WD40 repeat protein
VHLGLNPNLALNLAIDAMELSPHELTRSALVAAMMENRLHATLPAHPQKQYRDLDLSPDVELAVMALAGGTVRVFDLESNAMLWESPLHGAELLATRFSSDGEKIVSVSSDGHLIRWDREGSVLEELRLEEALTSAVIAADGERVAVVTEGGDALVCTAGMGAGQLLPVESLVEAVWLVCDDERLVAVDEAGVARCYSLSDSKLVLECALETEIVAVAGEAGGGVLACGGSDGEIELWELGGSRLVGSLSHGGELAGLRFSDGSDVLVSWGGGGGADDGGRVTVWSMATMESICSMNSERSVRDIALDPAGRRIAVCDGTKVVDLYDLQLGTHLGSLRQPWLLSGLRWSADGRRIGGLTGTGIAPIWSLDQRFGAPEAFSRLGSPVELLGVDGQTLVLHENGVLASWDVATGLVAAIDVGAIGSVRGMSESISGGDVLVWGDGGVAILDVEARELPWLLESAAGVEFAQGDNEIGVGRDSEGLVFWWQADGVRRELGSAWHIALSSDRAWIATGGEGTEVLLRPTAPGVEARTIAFEARWRSPVDIYSLVFQPDGAVLSVGAVDRKIRFFDVETGAALAQYRGLVFEELSYSLDGKAILGLPGDRHFARILDPLTGRRLMDNRTHHEEDVVAADLDSAAQFAVTGSLDGVIQVWSVAGGSAFVIHDHGDVPISDVIFDGEGEELRVLAAAWDGLLWGLAVHPMNSAFEHEPEAMSTSDAQKETESALPFSYSPLRKLSGISTEG